MLHKKILSIVVSSLMLSVLNAEHNSIVLPRIEQHEIEHYKVKIQQELRRNFHLRVAVVVGACAATGLLVYNSLYHKPIQEQLAAEDATPILLTPEEHKIFRSRIFKWGNIQPSQSWWITRWTKESFNTMLTSAGAMLIFSAVTGTLGPLGKYLHKADEKVEKIISKVFHPTDLKWFVTTHARMYVIFDEFEKHAAMIEGRKITSQPQVLIGGNVSALHSAEVSPAIIPVDTEYHMQGLITTWKLFIAQLESILGFMQLRTDKKVETWPLAAQRSQVIITKVITTVNNFGDQFEKNLNILNDQPQRATGLYDELRKLRAALEQEFGSFVDIDDIKNY